jgi:signal recognition particle receptor subunit beta
MDIRDFFVQRKYSCIDVLIGFVDRVLQHSDVQKIPLLFLANKQDLSEAKPASVIREMFLNDIKQDRPVYLQPTSALTG